MSTLISNRRCRSASDHLRYSISLCLQYSGDMASHSPRRNCYIIFVTWGGQSRLCWLNTLTSRCLARPMRHSHRINMERQIRHLPVIFQIGNTWREVPKQRRNVDLVSLPPHGRRFRREMEHERRTDDDWTDGRWDRRLFKTSNDTNSLAGEDQLARWSDDWPTAAKQSDWVSA